MSLFERMKDKMREGIKSFLQLQPAQGQAIVIQEGLDFNANAIKNEIWYRGEAAEIEALYKQLGQLGVNSFWAAVPSAGREIRKIHTGLPGTIVDCFENIITTDYNGILIENEKYKADWEEIAKENDIKELIKQMTKDALVIGDGAIKLSYDEDVSEYPIIEWKAGNEVDFEYSRGRFKAATFRSRYVQDRKEYCLEEKYGYGYINYKLYQGDKEVPLSTVDELKDLKPVTFADSLCFAIPFKVFSSKKYKGRGGSIFDKKADAYDAVDESFSQWIQALREGRSTKYIPDDLVPRDPNTGEPIRPNAFDNQFIKIETDMSEGASNKIDLEQPSIPHDSYMSTYITALDLALQGIISPSTLGIDVKKLDNADAQREKEKTTLYTRGNIIDALQESVPEIIDRTFAMMMVINNQDVEHVKATISFGEYANPSFEAQIETIGKAKTQGVMSNEAAVEELYGDTKDEAWKQEEIKRLNARDGYEVEEDMNPIEDDDFTINQAGGMDDEGTNRK